MRLHVKPRLQQEKWSLYWKTSMATRTFALDEFDMEVEHGQDDGEGGAKSCEKFCGGVTF